LAKLQGLIESLRIDIEQGEFCALAGESDADRLAQTLRGSGNDEIIVFDLQDSNP
jgi:hypothetical protein